MSLRGPSGRNSGHVVPERRSAPNVEGGRFGRWPGAGPRRASETVWGSAHSGRTGAVHSVIKRLPCRLDADAENPAYFAHIFNEPCVGYRMLRGETVEA